MTDINDDLIRKLEELGNATHLPLERRLIDTAVWYHNNKDRLPSHEVKRRLDFLEKAFDIQLEIMAMLVQRLQYSEGRPKSENLWMPRGGTYITDEGKKVEF